MEAYHPHDFYQILDEYTDIDRALAHAVRTFVDDRVLPIIEKHNRDGTFPKELIPQLAELGLLGACFDGYGCTDAGPVGYGLINQELERGDSGLRSFVSVQSSLVMYPIYTYGSEALKKRWLPELAAGRKIGCFGLTESAHGSDPGAMETSARPDGDGFILNGSKMWITNGSIADVAVIWAKLDGKIHGFLVETERPGFSARTIHNKFSLRASVTSELFLEDVRIPAENLLEGTSVGLKAALGCLNQARYSIAWGAVGAALACYDEALRYAKERVQFGRPIAGFQLVQKKLAEMVTEITKAQLLCMQLGRLKAKGKARPHHVSMAKMNNVKMALDVARSARDLLGAAGICDDFQVGRHMCNLESVSTYEGTHDIQSLIIGRKVTGLAAFT